MSFSFSVRWLIDDAAGDGQAVALGAADDVERRGAGNLRGVVAAAGQRGQADVALDDDDLGLLGNAGKAEAGRHLALVHHAAADEVRVGRVVHDQRVEIAGIGESAAHDGGIGDGVAAVGEADRAGLLQQAELGHLVAVEPLGQRGGRIDADLRLVARAAGR